MAERAKDCPHSELTNGGICMGCGITIDRNGGLPDWLKELAAQCPDEDLAALKDNMSKDNCESCRLVSIGKAVPAKCYACLEADRDDWKRLALSVEAAAKVVVENDDKTSNATRKDVAELAAALKLSARD
jgi:hypothetical protein